MKKVSIFILGIMMSGSLLAQGPQTTPEKPTTELQEKTTEEKEKSAKEKDSIPKNAAKEALKLISQPDSMKVAPKKEVTNVKEDSTTQSEVKYYQSTPDNDSSSKYYSNSNSNYNSNSNSTTYYRVKKKKSRNDIKTLTGKMSHSGGFAALTFKTSDFKDETMVLAGLKGGWIINRTLGIGLEATGIIPTTKYAELNPRVDENANVLGGYGGLFLEVILFSNEVVHITFPISSGAGWLGYQEEVNTGFYGTDGIIDDDVFWYAEPGIALELNIARNFRLNFGVSQRFTQDLKLYNTDDGDFDTKNYFLSLKIGGF